MCGIAGAFAYGSDGPPIRDEEILRTRDYMAARGPDGAGLWRSPAGQVVFAHRRLSIIDPTAKSDQPMQAFEGRYCIVFNGEIYNYRELRTELASKGHVFHTSGDTEVLLHLYHRYGDAMVGRLRGMFACAIWDDLERRLCLFRDPYGIKPLYWADDGKALRFASQVKALLFGGGVNTEISPAGIVGACLFGHVPDPHTLYKGIRALNAGEALLLDERGRRTKRYFRLADALTTSSAPVSDDILAETVREKVKESVRYHQVADVPVGAFLSGGIDSSVLVALMRECGQAEVKTFNICFEGNVATDFDERERASEAAATYETVHTTRVVTTEEFSSSAELIMHAMDQPSVDGVNTWFVSKAAHEGGLKVAFSGLGGDELFGGYTNFTNIPRLVRWCRWPASLPIASRLARRAAFLMQSTMRIGNLKMSAALELGGTYAGAYLVARGLFMPWELPDILGVELTEAGLRELDIYAALNLAMDPDPGTPLGRVMLLESEFYMKNQLLRDADWAAMAHSVEIRVPLVDRILFEQLAPTLHSRERPGKGVLARAPSQPLPDSILSGRKVGFSVPLQSLTGTTGQRAGVRRWFVSHLQHCGVELNRGAERLSA